MKRRKKKRMENGIIKRGINEYDEERNKSEINGCGLPIRGDRI
jgi:hypothetical protein